MSYAQFHLLWTLPEFLLLLIYVKRTIPQTPLLKFVLIQMGLALVYTTPWDNYLVAKEIWTYPIQRVLGRIGYVPLEEYFFFLIQAAMTTLIVLVIESKIASKLTGKVAKAQNLHTVLTAQAWLARGIGLTTCLGITLIGFILLSHSAETSLELSDRGTYLGLILIWSGPVCAVQWAIGGDWLVRKWRVVLSALCIPTTYLWIADNWAIANGIWSVSPATSTGIFIFPHLPLEEAVFFLMTNAMVVFGVCLMVEPAMVGRTKQTFARLRRPVS
jgi:lycopene cyclase domain-containing protein